MLGKSLQCFAGVDFSRHVTCIHTLISEILLDSVQREAGRNLPITLARKDDVFTSLCSKQYIWLTVCAKISIENEY